jgi:hypothetical protein
MILITDNRSGLIPARPRPRCPARAAALPLDL